LLLIEAGAKEVHAYISHGVLSGPAVERITPRDEKPRDHRHDRAHDRSTRNAANIRIVPTAPMFAQAIMNIWNGTSVFEDREQQERQRQSGQPERGRGSPRTGSAPARRRGGGFRASAIPAG
jgi:hypothetical protein